MRIQSGAIPIGAGEQRRYMRLGEKGTPDLLAIRHGGVHTWLEVKDEGGKLSPDQLKWREWAISNGVRIATVHDAAEAIAAVFAPRL